MGKIRTVTRQGDAQNGNAVYAVAPFGKRIRLRHVRISPTGADWSTDVTIKIFDTYTGKSANLVGTGDFTPVLGAAAYTSDFTGTNNWVVSGAAQSADLVIAGGETKTGSPVADKTLKITGAAGNSEFCIKSTAATLVAGTHYKYVLRYFVETGAGLARWGIGARANNDVAAYVQKGTNPLITENAWTTATFYRAAGQTTIDLASFTTATGNTADTLVNNGDVWLGSLVVTPLTNMADWTLTTTQTEIAIDWSLGKLTTDTAAGNGQTATQICGAGSNKLHELRYTLSNYTAATSTWSLGGTDFIVCPTANLTAGQDFLFSGSSNLDLVLTGDGTQDADFDDVELYELQGCTDGNECIVDGVVDEQVGAPYILDLGNSPLFSTTGFLVYATTAGTSVKLNMTMVYEIV